MIKALKEPSSFDGIDPSHLEHLLCILTYQAGSDHEQFNTLLNQFKQSTLTSFEYMIDTQFNRFLKQLMKRMVEFDLKWFRNQQAAHHLLLGVLLMINQRKVPKIFTEEFCQTLIDGGNVNEYLERPAKIIAAINDNEMQELLNSIKKDNTSKSYKQLLSFLNDNYSSQFLIPFHSSGIDLQLHQDIFMKICCNQKQVFLCTGPGVGKTTFLCGLVISKALALKQKVLFINSNTNLRYRDFTRVIEWLKLIKGSKLPSVGEYSSQGTDPSIIFISPEELLTFALPSNFHIIVDEFQALMSETVEKLVPLFEQADSFVGVTGSTMTQTHQGVLKTILPASLIINFPDIYKFNSIDRETIITSTIPQQIKEMDALLKQTQKEAPLLFIMDRNLIDIYKQKDKERKWVTFLDDLPATDFKIVLEQKFDQQVNGMYGCYAGTEAEGVGIEYPSNPNIESNGGVRVCICVQPNTYSDLCQFKRRTGRMSRKGVVHYIFSDKSNKGNKNYIEVLNKLLLEQEGNRMRKLKEYLRKSLQRVEKEDCEEEDNEMNDNEEQKQGSLKCAFCNDRVQEELNQMECCGKFVHDDCYNKVATDAKLTPDICAICGMTTDQYNKRAVNNVVDDQVEMKNEEQSVWIDTSSNKLKVYQKAAVSAKQNQKKKIQRLNHNEDEKVICQKGCGKFEHIGTCFKCQDCDVWNIIGAHNNCPMKAVKKDNIDQITVAYIENGKDFDMINAEEIAIDKVSIGLNHQKEQLNKEDNEEEKEINLYTDRDMCQQCFGEIYLNGPAHLCDASAFNQQEPYKKDSVKLKAAVRVDDEVKFIVDRENLEDFQKETGIQLTKLTPSTTCATPVYTNPVLEKLRAKTQTLIMPPPIDKSLVQDFKSIDLGKRAAKTQKKRQEEEQQQKQEKKRSLKEIEKNQIVEKRITRQKK